jgi:putative membrane protein
MRSNLLSGLAVFALTAGVALAQDRHTGTANRLTATDNDFAMKAAQGGMAEVQLGRLAEQNGSNDAVKAFGRRMVQDHTSLNNQLKMLAADQAITLPTELDAKDQATMDRLSKLSGAAFDRDYINDRVSAHRADIAEFRREADHGSNSALKQFAASSLPTLQEHLGLAEDAQKQVK